MIAVVDTGGANLTSLFAALSRLGARAELARDAKSLESATHVVLPGVGAAGEAMRRLKSRGLDVVLRRLEQPVLGICLGMHLLYEYSDEDETQGLGIFAGRAEKLAPGTDITVPHMGWSRVAWRTRCPLAQDLPSDAYFYFVHSFAVGESDATSALAQHGARFAAVSRQANFCATQFHPERSGAAGQQLLANFLALS